MIKRVKTKVFSIFSILTGFLMGTATQAKAADIFYKPAAKADSNASRGAPTMTEHGAPIMTEHGAPTYRALGAPTMTEHGAPIMTEHGAPTYRALGAPTMTEHGAPTMTEHGAPMVTDLGRTESIRDSNDEVVDVPAETKVLLDTKILLERLRGIESSLERLEQKIEREK